MMYPFVVLCCLLILMLIRGVVLMEMKRRRLRSRFMQFDCPPTLPLLGNTHLFVRTAQGVLRMWKKKLIFYNSPFVLWIFHKPVVVIMDPQNFQIVANKALRKDVPFLEDFIGRGLVTAEGDTWKQSRRLLSPAFNLVKLKKYFFNIFVSENRNLIEILDKFVDKEQFNLWPHLHKTAINNIFVTAMNYKDEDINNNSNEMSEYITCVLHASQLVIERYYNPLLRSKILFQLYKYMTGRHLAFKGVRKLPLKVIERKKKEIEISRLINASDYALDVDNAIKSLDETPKTFVDILLNSDESKLHFSSEQLADEVTTILSAGSETVALTSGITLLMLAFNQNIQARVYAELYSVFGHSERSIEADDIEKLVYLEQCIKETLRLHSTVPFIVRESIDDITLKDGKVIPANTCIWMPIVALHRNPLIYENPSAWNPDNFSAKQIAKRHPFSFVAFSNGPRSCIGEKYAMLSVKVQLCELLRRYHFSTRVKRKDLKFTFDILQRSTIGFPVTISRRTKMLRKSITGEK